MAAHLTAHLFGRHAPGVLRGVRDVHVDHVLLDADSGTLAWLGFEALARERVACDLALTALEREPVGPDEAEDARYLTSVSRRFGGRVARAGAGHAAAIYERRFAMPGRVLLSAASGAAGAGALGTLALEATADALAIALAGEPWRGELPPVIGVHLEGERPPCVRGEEIVRALSRTFERRGAGAVLEFTGAGVATLAMADRLAIARLAGSTLGAAAALFPTDEQSRSWLRARGRESDWRRLETGGRGFDNEWVLLLPSVAEMLVEPGTPVAVKRIQVGPFADDAVVRAWLEATADGPAPAVRVDVELSGRSQHAALTAAGFAPALERTRITVDDAALRSSAAETLLVGGAPGSAGWPCGVDAACAAARRARLADPRDGGRELDLPEGASAIDEREILESGHEQGAVAIERGARHRPWPRFAPWGGTWVGEVVIALAGRLDAAHLLAYGPRLASRRADSGFLASHLLSGVDLDSGPDALQPGGGALVLVGEFGGGAGHEPGARALVASGIRVLIARRFAPVAMRTFARHGILPCRWTRQEDQERVGVGDELEIPGLPESLEVGVALTLRHRTRGIAMQLEHDLTAHEVEWVRNGGWLSAVIARGESETRGEAR